MDISPCFPSAIWGDGRLPHEIQPDYGRTQKPPTFAQQLSRLVSSLSIDKEKGGYRKPGLKRLCAALASVCRSRQSTKGGRGQDGRDDGAASPIHSLTRVSIALVSVDRTNMARPWLIVL